MKHIIWMKRFGQGAKTMEDSEEVGLEKGKR